MKFTVTLTLDVDEQAYANHYLGGEVREPGVPADVLRGDVSLAVSEIVGKHLRFSDVVAVTDQPLDQYGNPVARDTGRDLTEEDIERVIGDPPVGGYEYVVNSLNRIARGDREESE